MDILFPKQIVNTQSDQYTLLMEQARIHNENEHIIDLAMHGNASSSLSQDEQVAGGDLSQHDDRSTASSRTPVYHSSSSSLNRLNTVNSTFTRRGDGYDGRPTSLFNTGFWIFFEALLAVSQIVASIVVLSLSKNENPQVPLFVWVVGYAIGCFALLPILFWRFHNRHQETDQISSRLHQGSSQGNPHEPTTYTAILVSQASEEEHNQSTSTVTSNGQNALNLTGRLNGLVDHFKMALDCFFAVWFVVGNVWIFGGHGNPTDAPKLYRLCLVFLTFSSISYAMPFILCTTICCCFPCLISILGIRRDYSQTRGASDETINALPTYKFNLNKSGSDAGQDDTLAGKGGVLAIGTDKERVISEEDAVCCICLARYVENDELRELPCFHVLHVDCVDRWLKINASCPLCKTEVRECNSLFPFANDVRAAINEVRG